MQKDIKLKNFFCSFLKQNFYICAAVQNNFASIAKKFQTSTFGEKGAETVICIISSIS